MSMIDLNDLTAQRLRNVAYSAEIDLEGSTKKDEIIERLEEENVELTANGWEKDGEEFELREQVSRPSQTNIIYGFQRAGATEEIMEEIQELFEDTDYKMLLMEETDTGKKPFKVIQEDSD